MPHAARLELVKWLAFAAMVADHVDLLMFGRGVPWLHEVGRFAFPAFALAFGVGLGASARPMQIAARVAVAGVLAQLVWAWNLPGHFANVLLVFAAWACTVALLRWHLLAGLACGLVVATVTAAGGEGGVLGVLLVGAGLVASWRELTPTERSLVLLVGGLGYAVLVGSVTAGLAGVLVAYPPRRWAAMPRLPGLLLWAYPVHLALLSL